MSNFIARWFGISSSYRKAGQPRKRTPFQLVLLEDRTVPAVFEVTSLAASGTGSLQAAIAGAASGDTIDFQVAGTVNLGSVLSINKNLTITGLGAGEDTISGQGICQIFNVSTANTSLTLNGLTLADGRSANDGGAVYALAATDMISVTDCTITGSTAVAGAGGGIFAGGDVSITGSIISDNTAKSTGGGVKSIGTVTVSDSTISGNTCGTNGGGINAGLGLSVTGSTISGNTATTGDGGGVLTDAGDSIINSTVADNTAKYGGGIFLSGTNVGTTLSDSTVADNKATATAGTGAGGIFVNGSGDTLYLRNSIVANDTDASGAAPDISNSASTTSVMATANYSLIGNTTGSNVSGTHDVANVAPKLGPLQNNGGNVETIALLANSPAINAGSNSLVPSSITTDERGAARIQGGTVDIGAFEVQPISQTVLSSSANPGQVGQSITFKATVSTTNANGYVPKGSVTFFVNGVAEGTLTLSSGHAVYTTSSLPGGQQTITAVFNPTDGSTASQTALTQAVQTPTTTSLSSSTPSVEEGQSLSFTATVVAGGSPVTAGSVDFYANGVSIGSALLNSDGQAILATSATWTGSPTIEVVFIPPSTNPTDLTSSQTSLSQILSGSWVFARRRT